MLRFDGRAALVAGAGGEIGAATAALLARQGARVWLTDIDAERVEQVRATLAAEGYNVRASSVDATFGAAVQQSVDDVVSTWARLDVAVNTVGWTVASPFIDEDEAYWRKIVELNLMSSIFLARSALPHMVAAKYGRLVLVSSLAGRTGRPGRVLYSAAKAGVIGLIRALALEMAEQSVTVNGVAPGATDTALLRAQGAAYFQSALSIIPRGRLATPDDQAFGIAVLASTEAAHITGQTLAIDGGATML
jgi:3-oxoacyl-[acyl-carrier protein] reductase/2-hydroxycyclohexanecarboxyl-CoA dehydrogenase